MQPQPVVAAVLISLDGCGAQVSRAGDEGLHTRVKHTQTEDRLTDSYTHH